MTGPTWVQHLAEYLIRRACRHLPADARDDRCREWTAELHVILRDPGARSRARRSARAVLFAADHARGARRLARIAGQPVRRFPSVRYDRLMLAALAWSGVGTLTGLAVLTWAPSHHGLAEDIFTASVTASAVFWLRLLRLPRRRSARSFRLMLAAAIASSAGLLAQIAVYLWLPSHHGLGNAIVAAATTVCLVFWWRAIRRPRRQAP